MLDATRTTTMLLDGLHDEADAAWSLLDARYRPILCGVARRMGLDDADAADVAQETLLTFLGEYRDGRYDRERGRLRSWLIAIARRQIAGAYRRRARARIERGASALEGEPGDDDFDRAWEEERRAAILRAAMDELRANTRAHERTIEAFELLVMRRMPVPAVARELNITEHDVYQAKSRLAQRLREIIARLDEAYDDAAP